MKRLFIVGLLLAGASALVAQGPPAGPGAGQGPAGLAGRGGVKVADAKPGDTRLVVSNGVRVPLEAVKAQAEQAVGHPFIIEYGASQTLKATMASGQPFEVAIVTPEVIDEMIAAGRIVAGSRFDVARVPVAIGQIGEAPKSDISTPAALKATLLKAKGVRWAVNGASLPTINKVIDTLGIRKEMEAKLNIPRDQVKLAPGEFELNINLASEILPVKTQVYLGNIPNEFNVPAIMAAGIGTTGDQQAARALIKFLQGPAIEPFLKATGMERGVMLSQAPAAPGQGPQAQGGAPAARGPAPFRTQAIKEGKVYWVQGGGGNSGVIIGQNGVIVIDAKTTPDGAKQLIAEVAKLTPKPITTVIITHSDGDHVNGLPAFPANVAIIAHANNRLEQQATFQTAAVEVDGGRCLPPADRLPNRVVTKERVATRIEGVNLVFHHFAPAHTSGDLVVYLPDEKVAFAGDLLTNNVLVHPIKHGSLEGWFTTARGLLALDVESYVGGHGNALDTKESIRKRMADYQGLRDKVAALAGEGKSLREIKTAMGDPAMNPSGCRGIPYLTFTELAYNDHMDKLQEIK